MPRLDVIGVIVSDMERAIHFCERLGLRFPEDPAIAFRCESPTDIASSPRMIPNAAHRRWTSFVADCSGLPSS